MSEFSSSLHIRTLDARGTESALLQAGYRGLVFGPKNGWLTFVPYAEGDPGIDQFASFVPKLSEATGATVLHYTYGEDHYWSFAIIQERRPISMFACGWDPKLEVSRERLDIAALQELSPSTDVEPFLQDRYCNDRPSAYGFAEALGLPAYRWLSPLLVEADTQHFLKHGGRRLGRKKPVRKTKLPESCEIATPGGDLSAREALDLIKTHTPFFDGPWLLSEASGHAHQTVDGSKLPRPESDWQFLCVHARTGERVHATVFAKDQTGRIGFQSFGPVPHFYLVQRPTLELPADWLDSSRIAEIVSEIETPKEVETPYNKLFSLSWGTLPEARWRVSRGSASISWTIHIDAVTGQVIRETVGWADENDYIVKWRRERLKEGAWQDI
ncbi:MAG: hypothetical protein ACLPX9_13430 [Rhodomicrobium sp.]